MVMVMSCQSPIWPIFSSPMLCWHILYFFQGGDYSPLPTRKPVLILDSSKVNYVNVSFSLAPAKLYIDKYTLFIRNAEGKLLRIHNVSVCQCNICHWFCIQANNPKLKPKNSTNPKITESLRPKPQIPLTQNNNLQTLGQNEEMGIEQCDSVCNTAVLDTQMQIINTSKSNFIPPLLKPNIDE